MKIETGKIEGDLSLSHQLVMAGMVTGNITVTAGGVLELTGMCLQSVIVKPGGTARILGMVQKDVINEGGSIKITGTIHGAVTTKSGTTVVDQVAVVVRGVTQAAGDNSQAVGLIGGAALGAAIGGPVGAVVGGVLGAILGKESKGIR